MLKRGRSARFVDPSLTVPDVHPIWMLAAGQATLPAIAERAHRTGGGAIFVPGLPSVRHILIDAGGRQHVLARIGGADLQLQIEGADILSGPIDLTFMVRGIDVLARTATSIVDLRRILSGHAVTAAKEPSWTARAINRRNACIVYDCITTGATYRDAATVLHGREIAQRDWRNSGIRDQIRRHWFRAQRLISGGYRELLE